MSENEGFGHAQNTGMESCEKNIFALNPDTEFLPNQML